jgi:hypothetical protein
MGGNAGPDAPVVIANLWRSIFVMFHIDLAQGETQGHVTLMMFDQRSTGRERHGKKRQISWTDRDCYALHSSSVVAPLLSGESAIRVP